MGKCSVNFESRIYSKKSINRLRDLAFLDAETSGYIYNTISGSEFLKDPNLGTKMSEFNIPFI